MRTLAIRPIGQRNQVTIPAQLLVKLHLHPGDLVEFKPQKEGLLLKPVEVVSKDEIWQDKNFNAMEELIDKQLKKGKYAEFQNSKQAVNFLKNKAKKQ